MSETVPQHLLHGILGPLLIGTWLNTALFSLELNQVWRYFSVNPLFKTRWSTRASVSTTGRRPDRLWIRVMVLWLLALDVAASMVGCAMAYTYTVSGWGSVHTLLNNDWLMTVFGILSALSILTMHLFLISRYYTLTRATTVSSILCLVAITACVLYVVIATFLVTLFSQLADRPRMRTVVIAWIVDSALTDWLISGTLIWFLYSIRTEADNSQGTVDMVSRLIHISGLSGAAPALLALFVFIGYFAAPESNFAFMFSLSGGRAAALTVLYNLNSRSGLAPAYQSASNAATAIYLDTTVDPRDMFGRGADSWANNPASQGRVLTGTGRATTGDTSVASLPSEYDAKPAIDLESVGDTKSRRVSIVRMSLPKSSPPTVEDGNDVELSASDAKAQL